MKKIALFFSMLLAIAVAANAQESRIGLKTGVNFANIGGDAETDMRVGYHLGGFAKFQLGDKFAIQPELLYSLQGFKTEGLSFGSVTLLEEENVNFHYVNLPVVLKLYLIEGLNLQVGPQVGYLASLTIDGEDRKDDFDLEELDFGLVFGAGFDLDDVQIGARYNLGLSDTNFFKSTNPDFEAQNRVIQVYIGFAF